MKKLKIIFLACLCILGINAPASADGTSTVQKIGGATFIGQYADKLDVTVDNPSFFHASVMDPGDMWQSNIVVKNAGNKDLQVSLLEIVNKLQDGKLLDALNLKITLSDGTVLYNGKYSKTGKPVMKWITLKPNQKATITVDTEFPSECGNEYQGLLFDTNWVFEVRAEETALTPSPEPSPSPKPSPSPAPSPKPSPNDEDNTDPTKNNTTDSNNNNNNNQNSNNNNSNSSNNSTNYKDNRQKGDSSQKESIVQTGDETEYAIWIILMLDAAVLVMIGINKRRKERWMR